MGEDDLTREIKMKQEEEFLKQANEKVQKQLHDGNVGLFSFLRESTVTVEEIEDSQPTLALRTLEYIGDDKNSEDEIETDIEMEPPPCPVHLM